MINIRLLLDCPWLVSDWAWLLSDWLWLIFKCYTYYLSHQYLWKLNLLPQSGLNRRLAFLEQSHNRTKMDEQDGTKPPLERIEKVTHVDGAELVCTILYYSTTAIETSIKRLREEVDKVRQKGNGSTSDECQEDDQEQAQEERGLGFRVRV